MSDIPSEDGENLGHHDGDPRTFPSRRSPRSPTVASTQDQSVTPSRPSSSVTGPNSVRGTRSPRPPSRRNHLNVSSAASPRTGTPNSVMSAGAGIGRPPSAASRPPSAASRTHVPSLTSHAFFRPMSSQRLQAQRATRQSRMGQGGSSDDGFSEVGSNGNRHSISSNPALHRNSLVSQEQDTMPPPSRDTELTEREGPDQPTTNTSLVDNGTVQSLSDSATPLQAGPANISVAFNSHQNFHPNTAPLPPAPRSPKSFGSKFLKSRGNSHPVERNSHGHEALYSADSSPISTPANHSHSKAGNNYQYFTGNTVFCWGGRLQNTRHRPINIATGLLVLIPGGLFFGFSWVFAFPFISIAIAKSSSTAHRGCGATCHPRYRFCLGICSLSACPPSYMLLSPTRG